ncbi:beta-ketoacyl-ACP synthase III [bacterium]|nr:beta-ketoacyl-ACP synthase III [bacterium]
MATAIISGSGLFTPPNSISNDELVTTFNAFVDSYNATNADAIAAGNKEPLQHSSSAFIEKASGIKSRFVMNKEGVLDAERMCPIIPDRSNDEPSVQCEMAVAATKQALDNAGLSVNDIDAVICAASNMQRAYPAMAVEIQQALGIDGFAYDMNVACSSATFGIQAAETLVNCGAARAVLMVNPEICSGHLNFRDRDSHFIFGDACTALVITSEDNNNANAGFRIVGSRLKTVFSNNIRNNFGFLNRCDENGVGKPDKLFIQQGRKVFKEVSPMVAEMITQHLGEHNLQADNLRRMWLHQANLNMNLLIAKKVLGREPNLEEAPVILDEYANTSSAGSIIAFHKHHEDIQQGEIGIICSFGAGYSAGSLLVDKR